MIQFVYNGSERITEESLSQALKEFTQHVVTQEDLTIAVGWAKPFSEVSYFRVSRGQQGFFLLHDVQHSTWVVREMCPRGHLMKVAKTLAAVPDVKGELTCSSCDEKRFPTMPFHELVDPKHHDNTFSGIAQESKHGWQELERFIEATLYGDYDTLTAQLEASKLLESFKNWVVAYGNPIALPVGVTSLNNV